MPRGSQNEPQERPRSPQERPKRRPDGPRSRPRASPKPSGEPPGARSAARGLQGVILELFWLHFRPSGASFSKVFAHFSFDFRIRPARKYEPRLRALVRSSPLRPSPSPPTRAKNDPDFWCAAISLPRQLEVEMACVVNARRVRSARVPPGVDGMRR